VQQALLEQPRLRTRSGILLTVFFQTFLRQHLLERLHRLSIQLWGSDDLRYPALDTEVIGKEYLLQNRPDAVAIGIFNYWFSTHPIDLWKIETNTAKRKFEIRLRPDRI
jgi:hypothetical protein